MSKNIFIMGDSYSTYGGYIPEGYHTYYSDARTAAPIVCGVEKTWWKILERENGLEIKRNDSYSGSTVCNTGREGQVPEATFLRRFDKYVAEDFFAANRIDTALLFGGTNDSWVNCPIGELKYSDPTEEELLCVLPAFCYLIQGLKDAVKNVIVIVNCGLKAEVTEGIVAACEKIGVPYVRLHDIDKECGHPTELGMRQIADQVGEVLRGL